MTSLDVTKEEDEEKPKPPMFMCCYAWEKPKMTAVNMQGQDVIENDYVNGKR